MKLSEIYRDLEPINFFILDSHQEAMSEQNLGHRHSDRDFFSYGYNIHHFNKLKEGSFFLYRRPGKLSKDGKFRIYGGGVIHTITQKNSNGDVEASIKNAYKIIPEIVQGDEFIENFVWDTRRKPGPGWKGFWINYGMNSISENDFNKLIENLQCELIINELLNDDDDTEDEKLIKLINQTLTDDLSIWNKKTKHTPILKNEKITSYNETYIRNKDEAMNALRNASHLCEINICHKSFLRKDKSILYMEPHHLIPMKFQSDFEFSIDVEENIVCLCSNCHNMIHYGNSKEIIVELFNQRKSLLHQVGINIDLESLLVMYNYKI